MSRDNGSTIKGKLYGMRRKDFQTVAVAFGDKIIDVLDKNIKWQIFIKALDDDSDFSETINNGEIIVGAKDEKSLGSWEITLCGKKEVVKQALKTIGYNL